MEIQEEKTSKLKTSEAQRRASKAYYERNKATIIAKGLERSKNYYATNETYREKRMEIAKKGNQKYKEKIKEMTEFIAKITELKIPNL
jgi:hypothetical protein